MDFFFFFSLSPQAGKGRAGSLLCVWRQLREVSAPGGCFGNEVCSPSLEPSALGAPKLDSLLNTKVRAVLWEPSAPLNVQFDSSFPPTHLSCVQCSRQMHSSHSHVMVMFLARHPTCLLFLKCICYLVCNEPIPTHSGEIFLLVQSWCSKEVPTNQTQQCHFLHHAHTLNAHALCLCNTEHLLPMYS